MAETKKETNEILEIVQRLNESWQDVKFPVRSIGYDANGDIVVRVVSSESKKVTA